MAPADRLIHARGDRGREGALFSRQQPGCTEQQAGLEVGERGHPQHPPRLSTAPLHPEAACLAQQRITQTESEKPRAWGLLLSGCSDGQGHAGARGTGVLALLVGWAAATRGTQRLDTREALFFELPQGVMPSLGAEGATCPYYRGC